MFSKLSNVAVWAAAFTAIVQASAPDGNAAQIPLIQVPSSNKSAATGKKVAIIGAGAAGTSAAYHLRKFASSPVHISIYETNPYIGGRTTTIPAYDNATHNEQVELGGSIFVKVNKILYEAAGEFNLSVAGSLDDGDLSQVAGKDQGPLLGIWDGSRFVYTQQGDGWWDIAKMVWKYGVSPLRAQSAMKDVVGKFLTLYEAPQFPWADLSQAVEDVGLGGVVSSTGEQFLKVKGVSDAFAREVVQAATRVNYAQNLRHIHGVEAMVCLATEGAMSVQGGNWRIFERMAEGSGAEVYLNRTVGTIKRTDDGKFSIGGGKKTSDVPADRNEDEASTTWEHDGYDTVILAAPYQFADIDFEPSLQYKPEEVPYVKLHVTLFTSPHRLVGPAFGLPEGEDPPRIILTTLGLNDSPGKDFSSVGEAGFFSISTLRPVTHPITGATEYLYKIFSPKPVDDDFLDRIFGFTSSQRSPTSESTRKLDSESPVTWIHRKEWHSYPHEFPRTQFEKLRLDESVWYTSGIENFISTMETSALSGMNVARLVADEWEMQELTKQLEL